MTISEPLLYVCTILVLGNVCAYSFMGSQQQQPLEQQHIASTTTVNIIKDKYCVSEV